MYTCTYKKLMENRPGSASLSDLFVGVCRFSRANATTHTTLPRNFDARNRNYFNCELLFFFFKLTDRQTDRHWTIVQRRGRGKGRGIQWLSLVRFSFCLLGSHRPATLHATSSILYIYRQLPLRRLPLLDTTSD